MNFPNSGVLDNPNLIIVNQQHPIQKELKFERFLIGKETINTSIINSLSRLFSEAEKNGFRFTLVSGYRSIAYQKNLFDQSVQRHRDAGYSLEQAQNMTLSYSQMPGSSEHHTGLAVDIIDTAFLNDRQDLYDAVDQLISQQWLINHAVDYGFILRYPKAKVNWTGINYEPWHFRFVGQENAIYMTKNGLSLEEYIEDLTTNSKSHLWFRTQYNDQR
ncbi:M15 family metallopeptidase [Leuconostoc lactis]|uniref:M15 family metallopeptidase n=1 Tax=Leuconostoc lactis TaxID=1246 RepID=UPI000BABB3F6|nr:M15 family metallopeptidase [Leuconostoc lactis]MDI6495240.1 M15 family metallopeptidase [Leuconostoc lactis]PAV32142.1 peptidase M15 [Leuconostoc lactis]